MKQSSDQTIAEDQEPEVQITLARPVWLIVGCCCAAAAKLTIPSIWIFYPPTEDLFGAAWAQARLLSGLWAVFLVLFLVLGGLLGDHYGRRRVLLAGLLVSIGANVLLSLGPSPFSHIILRIVGQMSAMLVLPLTLAPLYIFFHGQRRLTAFGWYTLTTSLAAAFASPQANFMLAQFGWHSGYVTSLVFGLLGFVLIFFSLPESRNANPATPNAALYAGWTLVVLGAVYLLIHAGFVRVWQVPVMIVTSIVIVIGIGFVIWWDIRTPGNFFRSWNIRQRDLTMLIAVGVVIQLVLMAFFLPTFRYFGVVKEYALLGQLLALLPLLVGMLAAVYFVARIWQRGLVRRLLATSLALAAAGIAIMAIAPARMPYIMQILPLGLCGFALIAAKTVWADAFFQTVIDDYIGLNAAINSATMQIGGALGSALGGHLVVLFGYRVFQANVTSISSLERMREIYTRLSEVIVMTIDVPPMNLRPYGAAVWKQYIVSYAAGYGQTMLTLVGISLATAAVIFFGLRRSMRYTAQEVEVDLDASIFENVPPLLPPGVQAIDRQDQGS